MVESKKISTSCLNPFYGLTSFYVDYMDQVENENNSQCGQQKPIVYHGDHNCGDQYLKNKLKKEMVNKIPGF